MTEERNVVSLPAGKSLKNKENPVSPGTVFTKRKLQVQLPQVGCQEQQFIGQSSEALRLPWRAMDAY